MTENRLVSILMPFKNEEKYIQECIQSILNQDYQHWELLAIDDHSDDESPNMVQVFSQSDSRVRYVKNEGVGVIEALKTGLSHCKGICVTRMDADDVKSPDNIGAMLSLLEPGKIALGLVKYFREDGLGDGYAYYEKWINEVNGAGKTWDEVYRECVIPSPCWLVYKDDLIRAGAFDSTLYPEDYDLCFRFYRAGLTPVCVPKVLHFWRDHDIRTTRVSKHYSDNHFAHLKVHYFLEIDYDTNLELVLLGAGKKAKKIAQLLRDKNMLFKWFTNSSNKVGHDIYGIIVQNIALYEPKNTDQIIVAMANFDVETINNNLVESLKTYYFY